MKTKEWDYTKLPKWAQQRITQLENSIEWYKDKLRQKVEGDSEVWVQDYIDGDQALPSGTSIIFKLDNGEITLRVREGDLEVYAMASRGGSGLAFLPRSSNYGFIRVVDR